MKFAFDLDGVLRDLHGFIETMYSGSKNMQSFGTVVCEKFKEWDTKLINRHDQKEYSFVEFVEKYNYIPLLYANPTEYLTKESVDYIDEIWTHQSEKWIYYTQKWIDKYIVPICGYYPIVRYLTPIQKLEMLEEHEDYYLIEDNPTLPEHNRIILVDRLYNEYSDNKRVHNLDELIHLIETIK